MMDIGNTDGAAYWLNIFLFRNKEVQNEGICKFMTLARERVILNAMFNHVSFSNKNECYSWLWAKLIDIYIIFCLEI